MVESTRKLAAIVFTDIAGFTELSSRNEAAALALVTKQRELFQPKVDEFGGRWLKEMGDGLLLSFDSSLNAVNCAVWLQHLARNVEGLNIRIGVHTGDVVIAGGDVLGDGVNVASRIEPLAPVGGVALSKKVQLDLASHPEFSTGSIGLADLKGVNEPVEVFCLTSHGLPGPEAIVASSVKGSIANRSSSAASRGVLVVGGVVAAVALAFAGIWFFGGSNGEEKVAGKETDRPKAAKTPPGNSTATQTSDNSKSTQTDTAGKGSTKKPVDRSVAIQDFKVLGQHQNQVRSVSFGPNGKWLVSGGIDNEVLLWNLETGKQEGPSMKHSDEVNCVDFSPDGTMIVSGGDDNSAILWSVKNGSVIHRLTHRGAVWGVAFSPDGQSVATASAPHDVTLWRVKTGEKERPFTGHNELAYCVAFNSHGDQIVSGDGMGTFIIWNRKNGAPEMTISKHKKTLYGASISPNGKWLATSGDDKKLKLLLWDFKNLNAENAEPVHNLSAGHARDDGVNWVTFSPDGSRLVSAGEDGPAIIWDVETGEKLYVLEGYDGLWGADFSPDGKTVATAGFDNTVRLWKIPASRTGN